MSFYCAANAAPTTFGGRKPSHNSGTLDAFSNLQLLGILMISFYKTKLPLADPDDLQEKLNDVSYIETRSKFFDDKYKPYKGTRSEGLFRLRLRPFTAFFPGFHTYTINCSEKATYIEGGFEIIDVIHYPLFFILALFAIVSGNASVAQKLISFLIILGGLSCIFGIQILGVYYYKGRVLQAVHNSEKASNSC